MARVTMRISGVHSGNLVLVTPQYAHREKSEYDIVRVSDNEKDSGNDVYMDRTAAAALDRLIKISGGWENIVPVSGWRSLSEQQKIWDDTIAESGEEFTRKFVAVPGCSEHQTGLAIDLGLRKDEVDFICPDFPYDGVCRAFRSNAADYGFIEWYPAGKEEITKIGHEPWHFRYVGVPHAAVMEEKGLTLEEYIEMLREYPYGKRGLSYCAGGRSADISYLPAGCADGDSAVFEADDAASYEISGNNVDGFIITEWR